MAAPNKQCGSKTFSAEGQTRDRLFGAERHTHPITVYDEQGSAGYHGKEHIRTTQAELTAKAIELLGLSEGRLSCLLDIGCGSGFSIC